MRTRIPSVRLRRPGRWLAWLGVALLGACGGGGVDEFSATTPEAGGSLRPFAAAYALAEQGDVRLLEPGAVALPAAVDLRAQGLVPPVQNQQHNSCVAWALGYYLVAGLQARLHRERGQFLDPMQPENWFSPDYLYSQRDTEAQWLAVQAERRRFLTEVGVDPSTLTSARCVEPDDPIGCMRPERALEILSTNGCSPWTWMCAAPGQGYRACDEPTRLGAGPSRAPYHLASPAAEHFRPACFVRFGSLDDLSHGTVQRVKRWLVERGTPVAVVARMTQGWVSYRGGNRVTVPVRVVDGVPVLETRGVCLDAGGDELGGQHMMTIVGYDDAFPSLAQFPDLDPEQVGSFLIANQWGTKWGQDGLMWIPCSELRKVWVAGYGLVEANPDAPPPSAGCACAQVGSGEWVCLSQDGNDVPANLVPVPGTGLDPPPLQIVRTSTPLGQPELGPRPYPPDAGVIRTDASSFPVCLTQEGAVGGFHVGEQIVDTADWYHFTLDVPQVVNVGIGMGTTPNTFTLDDGQVVIGDRVLETQLLGPDYTVLRSSTDGGLGRALPLGAGTYFLRVSPNHEDAYDRIARPPGEADPVRIAYALGVCAPSASTDPLSTCTSWGDAMDGPGQEHAYLIDVPPGAGLVLVVRPGASPQGFHVTTCLRGADFPDGRCLQSRIVASETAVLDLVEASRSTPAQVYLRVRSRAPDLAAYFLDVCPAGARTEASPTLRRSDAAEADAVFRVRGDGAVSMELLTAAERARRPRVVVALNDYGPLFQVLLTDAAGVPLAGATTRSLLAGTTTAHRAVDLPAGHEGAVWATFLDPTSAPLTTFSACVLQQVSLRGWPQPDFAAEGADGNDTPPHAQDLPLNAPVAQVHAIGRGEPDPVTGAKAWWDRFDFFRVANTTGAPATIRVTVTDRNPSQGAGLVLTVWDRAGRATRQALPVGDTLTAAVPAQAGEVLTFLVEGPGPQTEYELDASTP